MADDETKAAADPFSSAVAQMHGTAKWIIGIFGAIGAILVAGTQLSSLGKLAFNDARLWVALLAFAIGLICVGVIIWHAAKVLSGGHVTRSDLQRASYNPSRDCLDVSQYAPGTTIATLLSNYDTDIKARNDLFEIDRSGTLTREQINQVKELNGRIRYEGGVVQQLAAAAYYNEVCKLFRSAIRTIFVAGAIGALALGLFAWAVNPPSPEDSNPTSSPSASTE